MHACVPARSATSLLTIPHSMASPHPPTSFLNPFNTDTLLAFSLHLLPLQRKIVDDEDDERGGEEAEQASERRDRGGAGRGGGRRERGGRRWRREGGGDSAASDARGALRGGAGHHAQERAGQRLRRHLLRRPHRLQVFGVRQWSLRGVLPLLGFLRRRATPHDAVPFVDSLLLRPGVDIRNPGSRNDVGGDNVLGTLRGRKGNVEQRVQCLRQLLQEGDDLCWHHLRVGGVLCAALPRLLLPPLQRLRDPHPFHQQQGPGDRVLPSLKRDRIPVCKQTSDNSMP